MRAGVLTAMAACIALSECALYPSQNVFEQKLKPFKGQPASALIAKLGYPTKEDQIAKRKVYVWSNSRLAGGTTYFCTVRAVLRDQDVIETVDHQGNEGGCEMYANKLQQ